MALKVNESASGSNGEKQVILTLPKKLEVLNMSLE
jgi:hypothetical protein